MTIKGVAGLVLLLALIASPLRAQDKALRHKVYDASLQLYMLEEDTQDGGTGKQVTVPGCTATAFLKTAKGYSLVTAAHCVVNEHKGLFPYDEPAPDGTLSIGYGDPGNDRLPIPVTISAVGNWHDGWDVAILTVETKEVLTVIPLGDETKLDMGDRLLTVSAPLGGEIKYYWEGYISATRHQVDPGLSHRVRDWKFVTLATIPGYEGSSGAAIVSVDQQAIVGVYTSQIRGGEPTFDNIAGVMFPASAIKTFIATPTLHLPLDKK